jgi:hypothetical protein
MVIYFFLTGIRRHIKGLGATVMSVYVRTVELGNSSKVVSREKAWEGKEKQRFREAAKGQY